MTNEEIIANYLGLLKSNVEVYVHGTIESSNKDIRDNLKYGLDQTLMSQDRTFNEMVKNSWYKVDNVDTKEINKVFKELSKKF